MPADLTSAVQRRVGRGKFSQYVTEAVARQLELDLLAELSAAGHCHPHMSLRSVHVPAGRNTAGWHVKRISWYVQLDLGQLYQLRRWHHPRQES